MVVLLEVLEKVHLFFTADEKTETKSPKPESPGASGSSPLSANPAMNFNAFDFSNMASILNVSALLLVGELK